MSMPNVLSIAGSDPSGGAGIQADLKTFCAHNVYGMAAITALTAQNTNGVHAVYDIPALFVEDQIRAILDDISVDAVKLGMLARADIIESVARVLKLYNVKNIILDPVMVATSGDPLIAPDAVDAMKEHLIPFVDVITPNIPEAEKLSRKAVLDMEVAASGLLELGAKAVFLKGGHLKSEIAQDVLATAKGVTTFEAMRVDTENTHGTGCTLSSAIAANLAKGQVLEEACSNAKAYVTKALKHADELNVGNGHGPVYHARGRGA